MHYSQFEITHNYIKLRRLSEYPVPGLVARNNLIQPRIILLRWFNINNIDWTKLGCNGSLYLLRQVLVLKVTGEVLHWGPDALGGVGEEDVGVRVVEGPAEVGGVNTDQQSAVMVGRSATKLCCCSWYLPLMIDDNIIPLKTHSTISFLYWLDVIKRSPCWHWYQPPSHSSLPSRPAADWPPCRSHSWPSWRRCWCYPGRGRPSPHHCYVGLYNIYINTFNWQTSRERGRLLVDT